MENTVSAMNEFLDRFEEPGKVRVAVEAGTHSPWLSDLLRERGFEVLVGNARKLRMIWGQDIKDDFRDAKMLARIGRFDPKLFYAIQHRSRVAQMDLVVLEARDLLVRNRTPLCHRADPKAAGAGMSPPHKSKGRAPRAASGVIGLLASTCGVLVRAKRTLGDRPT